MLVMSNRQSLKVWLYSDTLIYSWKQFPILGSSYREEKGWGWKEKKKGHYYK